MELTMRVSYNGLFQLWFGASRDRHTEAGNQRARVILHIAPDTVATVGWIFWLTRTGWQYCACSAGNPAKSRDPNRTVDRIFIDQPPVSP
jgi:hypothetical protein